MNTFCWWAISSWSGVGFHQDPCCNIYHPHQPQVFIKIHIAIFIILVRSRFSSGSILQYLSSSPAAGFHQDLNCNIYSPQQQQVFIRINIVIFIILIRSISRRASLEIAAGVVFISGPGCYLEYLWHFLWPGRAIIIINIFWAWTWC